MSVLSYNQIIELFEVISEAHYQIKRFGAGELSEADLNKYISENSTYPVFWATPVSVQSNQNTINYNFNLLFFDIVKKDKNNEQEVLSDTLQIALDVFRILKLEDDQFFVDGEPTISPFAGRYSEWVAGWSMEISIQVNFQENLCDIPYEGLNLTQILQNFTGGNIGGFGCDDLGTCIDFINLENNVSVALGGTITGGTYSSATTTLNLFNTTGGTIQITGFTNGGGGTSFNCNDLLNCTVITTLTGDVQTLQTQIVSAVSGGSYSAGTLTLNTIGNTPINITGFSNVDTLVTAFTYNNSNVLTIEQNNSQPPLSILINQVTGWTSTGDVNISGNTNVNGYVQFSTASTATSSVAKLTWNDVDGTLDLGLKGGNVTLQIGQEEVIRVVNKTGSNLLESNYQVVRIRASSEGGAQGQRLAVLLAQSNNKLNHSGILGIVTENIDNNQEGFITSFGNVRNINTTGSLQGETWIDGDNLWLSETVAGRLTNIQPQNHPVQIGYVLYAHPNQGKIFVKVDEGIDELSELHDVNVTGATDGQVLTYSASTGLWVPRTPTSGDVSNKYDKSGGTISGDVFIQSGLTANTISATTYQNLPTDVFVTGGTFNGSQITMTNNSGTSFNITGFTSTTGGIDTWSDGSDGTLVSGTTANSVTYTQLISGGTFGNGDLVRINYRSRTTINSSTTMRIYVNSTPDLSGSPILVGQYNNAGATSFLVNHMLRTLVVKNASNNTEVYITAGITATDLVLYNSVSNLNINWVNNQYIVFALQNTASLTQNARGSYYLIEKI